VVASTDAPATWIAVSVETATQWNALAHAIACADLAVPRDADMARMKAHEADMEARLRAWAAPRNRRDAVQVLQAAGVPAAPVYAAQDLLGDPQLVASGFWRRVERRFIGSHITPLAPYRLDGRTPPLRNPAPTLGEYNAAVLTGELGLSGDEITALETAGVIGTRAVAGTSQ
jgi:crotonobetainyl-CoA:carnitine CoA-transferase CaiB-like acyl-CoA transferase